MSLQPGSGTDTADSARWTLNLFSGFKLSRAGTPVQLSAKRERVLLAYLVLSQNCRQPRRKLATMLWDKADDETTLDNLRTCVWGLRKALGDTEHRIVTSDDDWISLDPSMFDVDAWTFRDLSNRPETEQLDRAAKIYTGELLDGLSIESEGFEAWLRQEAIELRNLAIDVLDRLAEQLAEAGETERAINAGRRLVQIDPLHERIVRLLMRLYAETGRRGAAVQVYRSLCETLRTELNAEPEEETRAAFTGLSRIPNDTRSSNLPIASPVRPALQPATIETKPKIPVPKKPQPETADKKSSVLGARRNLIASAGAIALLIAATVALGIAYFPGRIMQDAAPGPTALMQERPSLAILPLTELGGDTNLANFAEALTSDITNALSIVPGIFVIDRNSTLVYRNSPIKVQKIAKELDVRYVLEGSVQRADNRLRISAELIDALSGKQLWADRYDREASDVFALQDEITLAIITALRVEITEGEQERISLIHGTKNLQAWMIAGQGLDLLRRLTREDTAHARELYTQATSLDPNYPGAWDGLAWTYLLSVRFGWSASPQTDFKTAQDLAQKALALDQMRGRTYSLLGFISLMLNDHKQAVGYGEKAMALDPNGADITALQALTLTYADDPKTSIGLAAKAMHLSPYYPDWYRWVLGRAYRLNGQYKDAEGVLTKIRDGDSESVPNLVELAATYVEVGNKPQAESIAAKILMYEPRFSAQAWTNMPPYQNAVTRQREIDILKRAGLPN